MDSLSFQARVQPAREVLRELETGRAWTYQQFDQAADRVVTWLKTNGVVRGDRVVALAGNCAELVLLQHACARMGAIYVPINWRLSSKEIAALIEDAEPALVIGDELLKQHGLDGADISMLLAESASLRPSAPEPVDQDASVLMLFTSGTSGRPKGALLSLRNITETGISFSLIARITHESVVLCETPMFHVMGIVTNIHPAFMRGGAVLISSGFNPPVTLSRLADPSLKITHYFCVPQMAQRLRRESSFSSQGLSRLVCILSGGAPHPAANICQWLDDGIPVVDGFGMSETGTVSGMPLDPDLIRCKAGSVGIVHARMQYRIVDDAERDVSLGANGQLLLKGDNVFSSYWNRPDETKAAFTADGWFRTGDVVREDQDGFLWITDRLKDMYISGGENVFPVEIESALARLDDVIECAVVGQEDETWGQVGHLFIVLHSASGLSDEQITSWLRNEIAHYKVPKVITRLEKIPRNGAGKIEKHTLRKSLP